MTQAVTPTLISGELRRGCEWDACNVLVRFYYTLDTRDYDACAGFFAADGSWNRLGKLLEGRAAIRAALDNRLDKLAICHQLSNVFADVHDPQHATVHAYITAYMHMFKNVSEVISPAPLREPRGIWLLETKMEKRESSWKIRSHDMKPVFART